MLAAFAAHGPTIDGEIDLDPLTDSWALGLIYDALIRALARQGPLQPRLRTRGHTLALADVPAGRDDARAARNREALSRMTAAYDGAVTGAVPDLGAPYAEAVAVRLDHQLGRWWCVYDPYTAVDLPRTDDIRGATPGAGGRPFVGRDQAGDWRRERWAQRYNQRWAEIIDAWAKLFAPHDQTTVLAFDVKAGAGMDAQFSIGAATAWSHPAAAATTGLGR